MRTFFTSEQINYIIQQYTTGKTQKEISKCLNCAQTTISAILSKNNIPTRVGKKIIYNDTNVSFFDKIKCEESAYFLGLLYADGCVQIKNSQYQVSLKLKKDDTYIIEKFRDIMSPSSPIKLSCNKYSYFRINKKEICEQLISHGCVPNKSFILEFPTTVPKELLHHFLRGYSDGDGCIYINKLKHSTNFIWKIVSTKQFCEKVSSLLNDELQITISQQITSPKSDNKITTTLSVGGNNQTETLLDWLYQDATIYLPRKYDKYLEFKKFRLTYNNVEYKKINLSDKDVINMYNEGKSSIKISKFFNVSKPSILKILHKHNIKIRTKSDYTSSSKSISDRTSSSRTSKSASLISKSNNEFPSSAILNSVP